MKSKRRSKYSIFIVLAIIMSLCMLFPNTVHAQTKWKKITKSALIHKWYNETAKFNEGEPWAGAYITTFRKNGTVIQKGYRNKDIGTYKISKDKRKVTAVFSKCYFDTPGEGYKRIKNYKYTVIYRLKNKKKLYARYSRKATETNAGTGYLYR